jgi:hypothetical protein
MTVCLQDHNQHWNSIFQGASSHHEEHREKRKEKGSRESQPYAWAVSKILATAEQCCPASSVVLRK